MKRVLVVSPHPDDEAIGCGGSLRAHSARGDRVRVVFLTSGEAGGHGQDPALTARRREREAERAASLLGLEGIDFWRLPDGRLRDAEDTALRLARLLARDRPAILYVPHHREAHRDHRAAARLVQRARRLGAGPRPAKAAPRVLAFEVWTPLQRIDEVVDISAHIEVKVRAIRAYASQCRVMRFDAAFRALARYRGEMHSGYPAATYAEIFAEVRPPSVSAGRTA